jgi:hypothetical protein
MEGKMELEQLYYIGELVGVIIIIGSLIFVGAQVRQNTKALRTTVANDMVANWQRGILTVAESDTFAASMLSVMTAEDESKVSPEAILRTAAYFNASQKNSEFCYHRYVEGDLDEGIWSGAWAATMSWFASPIVLNNIWPSQRNFYSPAFSEFVDEALANEEHIALANRGGFIKPQTIVRT